MRKSLLVFLCALSSFHTLDAQRPLSLCPDSAGVNHCENLRILKRESMFELERVGTLRNPKGVNLELKHNLPSSIRLIDSLKTIIEDGFERKEKPVVLRLCKEIIRKNYIAKNGTYRNENYKSIVPYIKSLAQKNFNQYDQTNQIEVFKENGDTSFKNVKGPIYKEEEAELQISTTELSSELTYLLVVSLLCNAVLLFLLINYLLK